MLTIVIDLGRFDREDEINRVEENDDNKGDDFDPWASVKRYT